MEGCWLSCRAVARLMTDMPTSLNAPKRQFAEAGAMPCWEAYQLSAPASRCGARLGLKQRSRAREAASLGKRRSLAV